MNADTVSLPAVHGAKAGTVVLSVNGQERELRMEPRVSLLDALREHLGLTGSKKGCDQGTCGACTVWVDGRRVLACLTLAVTCEGREVTTIEGLSADGALHPMQAAFVDRDAFQCGYCTPGQIMSAVAVLKEGHAGDDAEIAEWMSGNICRCAAYPNIRAAIRAGDRCGRRDRAGRWAPGGRVPGGRDYRGGPDAPGRAPAPAAGRHQRSAAGERRGPAGRGPADRSAGADERCGPGAGGAGPVPGDLAGAAGGCLRAAAEHGLDGRQLVPAGAVRLLP